MSRAIANLLVLVLAAGSAGAAPPRIGFERIRPAALSVGDAEEVALTAAPRGDPAAEEFAGTLLERVNVFRTLRAVDARGGAGGGGASLEILSFRCELRQGEGEGSTRDRHGNRVKRVHVWVDATCHAVIALARPGAPRASFRVSGEGTSPRVESVSDDERAVAIRQATRFAAVAAAERFTPRRVRESIELEVDVPRFDEAMSFVDLERLDDARAVWERALRESSGSAALRFNLAVVCEALGDYAAARRHYVAARALAPGRTRYASELKRFENRAGE